MSKKQEVTKELVVAAQDLTVLDPKTFTPATMIGTQTNVHIPTETLPEEFQGTQLETLETTFPPTVKWLHPGNYVAGVFVSAQEKMGPNNSWLYNFDANGRRFSIWGNTVLDRVFQSGVIQPGDMLLITYIGDIATDMNPCKMFDVKKATPRKA